MGTDNSAVKAWDRTGARRSGAKGSGREWDASVIPSTMKIKFKKSLRGNSNICHLTVGIY